LADTNEMEQDRNDSEAQAAPANTQGRGGVREFFARRWRGDLPLGTAVWRDMVLFGSALNLATTAGALLVLAAKGPIAVVILLHALPAPVDIFLFMAVLRASRRAKPAVASMARTGALVWLILAITL
jgi:hypothetical protein